MKVVNDAREITAVWTYFRDNQVEQLLKFLKQSVTGDFNFLKIQDGDQGGLEKKCQHWFSDSQDSKLSKNV